MRFCHLGLAWAQATRQDWQVGAERAVATFKGRAKDRDAGPEEIEVSLTSWLRRKRAAIAGSYRELAKPGRLSALLFRISRGRSGIALIDQVLVGGSNLATNVVLVRGLGLSEFGKFSIALALLFYANSLQMSFVTSSMLSIAPLMDGRAKREFVEGMLAVQVLASAALFAIFALAGVIARIFTDFYSLRCVIAFACCVGTYQLQDWLRRYYFLYRKAKLVLINDFISYLVQLLLLFVLWRFGQLTLFRTFLVMCVTSVAACIMGPITDRLWPAIGRLRESWSLCKGLSRDLLIANQVRWLGAQGVLIVGTGIVGTAGIGGLRATQSLAGPVSLVMNSLENVLPIRVAEELKTNGAAGAYRFIQRGILFGVVFFGLLILPVGIFGKPILRFLFGNAMVAFYVPMLLQLVGIMTQLVARLWVYLYRGMQETRAILRANAICAAANIGTVYFLGHYWHASGIVLSSVLGQGLLVGYSMFYWMRHREELLNRRYVPGGKFESVAPMVLFQEEFSEAGPASGERLG